VKKTVRVISVISVLGSLFIGASTAQSADYVTAPVSIEKSGNMAMVSGTVVPFKEVVLSAQIPGEVKFLAGHEGDKFKADTVLVTIDDAQIQAQRRAAVAVMMSADASLRNAHVQYSKEIWSPQSGRNSGMGMPKMMDRFFSPMTGNTAGGDRPWVRRYADLYGQARQLDDARSRLIQSKSKIEELDAKLRDARLKAPFEGVITQKLVEMGDTVQPGQQLMRFAHITYLRIQAEVPVRLVASLQKGMVLSARLDVGTGVDTQARVAQIFPMADKTRHTVTVKFDLPRGVPGGPGMYAEINIPSKSGTTKQLPSVPSGAVFYRGSLPAVLILKNGKPSMRLVRVGGSVGSGRVTILSGLLGGEQVIINPQGGEVKMQTGSTAQTMGQGG